MKLTFLITLLVFSNATQAIELRNHYIIVKRDRTPAFEATVTHDQSDRTTTRTYLIADSIGPYLMISVLTDYEGRRSVTTYHLMRGSHDSATVTINTPFTSTTSQGLIDELKRHPELANAVFPMTILGPGGRSMTGSDDEWRKGSAIGEHRARARQVLGNDLTNALDRVRELAGLPAFADFNGTFGYFFDDSQLVHHAMTLMVATVKDDCTFDAAFSMPCHGAE